MAHANYLPDLFQTFISKQGLIKKNESLLIAYSGGADSTALLHLLIGIRKKWGLRLHALHFHHGLRPESDLELDHCRQQCAEWDIPFYSEFLDVQTYSQKLGVSTEEGGRVLRYNSLNSKMNVLQCDSVLTAHHADDVAETLLLHLFQGSGISGLASLKSRRGFIIRPLLFCDKSMIIEYLTQQGISYINDGSNLENKFQRNYVRNEIVPLIKDRFPAFTGKIQNLCSIIELEDDDWNRRIAILKQGVIGTKDRVEIPAQLMVDITQALGARLIRSVIRDLMGQDYYPSFKDINRVYQTVHNKTGNREVLDKQGLHIDVSYGDIVLSKKNQNFPLQEIYVKLKLEKDVSLPHCTLRIKQEKGRSLTRTGASIKSCDSLMIRSWKTGDRFRFNLKGTQKLQDYFVNNKIKSWQRRQTLVIVNEGAEIMAFYIPASGWRVSRDFYIRENEKAVFLEVIEG